MWTRRVHYVFINCHVTDEKQNLNGGVMILLVRFVEQLVLFLTNISSPPTNSCAVSKFTTLPMFRIEEQCKLCSKSLQMRCLCVRLHKCAVAEPKQSSCAIVRSCFSPENCRQTPLCQLTFLFMCGPLLA